MRPANPYAITESSSASVVVVQPPDRFMSWAMAFAVAVAVGSMWWVSLVAADSKRDRTDLAAITRALQEQTRLRQEDRELLIRIETAVTLMARKHGIAPQGEADSADSQ